MMGWRPNMTPSVTRYSPKLDFEFMAECETKQTALRTMAGPKIAATEQRQEPPLRRRAVLPAIAATKLECGALPKPRTTT